VLVLLDVWLDVVLVEVQIAHIVTEPLEEDVVVAPVVVEMVVVVELEIITGKGNPTRSKLKQPAGT
jgi:hypothetical protein